jgi:hypothetical protein
MAQRSRASIRNANDQARTALHQAMKSPPRPGHIGDLSWWLHVSGWRKPVADVHAEFRVLGVDPAAALPASPDWPLAFSRAIRALITSVRKRGLMLEDAAVGSNGERRVAVARALRNGSFGVDANQGIVSCPKNGPPIVEREDADGVVRTLIAATSTYHDVYTSDDLRVAVVRAFERAAALNCRDGLYWVPPAGTCLVTEIKTAVETTGWGRIEQFSGYDTDASSQRACVNAVNDGLESQLALFAEQVAKYAGADPSRTRVSTIESKIDEAKRLREQGALYRTILGAAVESIDDRMTAIEDSLRSTLGLVESSRAA